MKPATSRTRFFLMMAALAAVFHATEGARGEMWTNAAGHAVAAEWVETRGNTVVLKLADGREMAMPLSSLSPAERERARRLSNRVEIPPLLRVEFDLCARTLKRLGVLRDAERIAPDEYEDQRRLALSRLESACVRQELPEEERRRILAAADGS